MACVPAAGIFAAAGAAARSNPDATVSLHIYCAAIALFYCKNQQNCVFLVKRQ